MSKITKTKIIYKNNHEKISHAIFADTILKRFKGLMLKKDIKCPLILEIPKSKYKERSSIHSFFMRFPIDIIFINNKLEIYDIYTLYPWKLYTPKKTAKYIIEFKKGSIKKFNLKINTTIEIKNEK